MSISGLDDLRALRWVEQKIRAQDPADADSLKGRLTEGPYRHRYELPPPFTPHGGGSIDDVIASLAERLTTKRFSSTEERHASSAVPAGYTYFGQFITHDLSLFGHRRLLYRAQDRRLGNLRTPRFDLDSVYGKGPEGSPHVYSMPWQASRAHERASFLLSKNLEGEDDLLRAKHGAAVIPDHRNDENVIVSQVHLAIQKVHNRILQGRLRQPGAGSLAEEFFLARKQTIWNYQWLVFHEYLPRLLDPKVAKKLADALAAVAHGPAPEYDERFGILPEATLQPGPWLPVEFVLAGMRFGHAMVRSKYVLNSRTSSIDILGEDHANLDHHLQGGRPLVPNWTVDWAFFFDEENKKSECSSPPLQFASPIGPRLTHLLGRLPRGPLQESPMRLNLAALTLTLGVRFGLTSGQHLAREMGKDGLDVEVLDECTETPLADALWPYVLREAESEHQGKRLGRVGSWILLQAFWSRLVHDDSSFLYATTPYRPSAWPNGADGAETILAFLKAGDQA